MKQKHFLRYVHIMFAVWLSFLAVLFASCSMVDSEDAAKNSAATEQTVTVRIAGLDILGPRTAIPKGITEDSFAAFKLIIDGKSSEVQTWIATADKTAYDVMTDTAISLPTGKHTFVLTGAENSGALYKGELEQNIDTGSTLSFRMYLSALPADGIGSLSIEVECYKDLLTDYNAASIVGELYATSDNKTYAAEDYRLNSRQTKELTDTSSNSGRILVYTIENIPSGCYIAAFTLYDKDGYSLGTWLELCWISAGHESTLAGGESTAQRISMKSVRNFKITYKTNGGAFADGKTAEMYNPIDKVVLPVPTKDGYTFAGWYTSNDGGATLSDTPLVGWEPNTRAESITVYAKWEVTLSYDANAGEGGAAGTMDTVILKEGETTTLEANAFKRDGYVFSNWNTAPDGTGTAYEDEGKYKATETRTLYAQWIALPADSVAIHFKTSGGTAVDAIVLKKGGSLIDSDQPVPSKSGSVFMGWYTSDDDGVTLSETPYAFSNITADITLYAMWAAESYTITYLDGGGADFSGTFEDSAPSVHQSGTETALPVPVKDEFIFAGWYENLRCNGTKLTALSAEGYDYDITLYAKWVRTTYYVTSSGNDANDGSEVMPISSIYRAVNKIIAADTPEADYTIKVTGTLKHETASTTIIVSDLNGKAASLTICGTTGNTKDILDGNSNSSNYVLNVQTSVPVILRNIKLTKSYRGGLHVSSDASVTLSDGVLITSIGASASLSQYVVYVENTGKLIMEDGAEISNNYERYTGTVYLLGDADFTMNGGKICNNTVFAESYSNGFGGRAFGGGVTTRNGSAFTMNGGEISGNKLSQLNSYETNGGGVYVENATFTMNGGTIKDNTAVCGSGVYLQKATSTTDTAHFIMNGGVISGKNGDGVGVYLAKDKSDTVFEMTGGEIRNNKIAVKVYGYTSYGGATFKVSGSASIPLASDATNYVYLDSLAYVTVAGALTSEPVLTLQKGSNTIGTPVLAGDAALIESECAKFEVSDKTCKVGKDGQIAQADFFYITYYDEGGEDFSGTLAEGSPTLHYLSMTDTLPAPTRPHATFEGWYTTSDCTGTVFTELSPTNCTEAVSLYAKWTLADSYSITYKDEGNAAFSGTFASEAPATHYVDTDTKLPIPQKDGYVFLGWYTDSDCTGTAVKTLAKDGYTDAITLYAKWKFQNATVIVDTGDISITVDASDTSVVTLTASDGFTGYSWLVYGQTPATLIAGATVSTDGKVLTLPKADMTKNFGYEVTLTAAKNGKTYTKTADVMIK